MTIEVRSARVDDLEAMASLISARRKEYEAYQPVFWRLAPRALFKTKLFYFLQLFRRSSTMLVAVIEDNIVGFLIATITKSPPVYDPGGSTAIIDDFAVAAPRDWITVGEALLTEAFSVGKKAGWRQIVVICGAQDEPKSAFLRSTDLRVASTWWTAQT